MGGGWCPLVPASSPASGTLSPTLLLMGTWESSSKVSGVRTVPSNSANLVSGTTPRTLTFTIPSSAALT